MTLEKTSRNKEILVKHRSGKSNSELAREYEISEVRIRQILQQERKHQLSKLFLIPEIKQACEYFNAVEGMHFRILNALHNERLDVHNKWRRLTRDELLSIRGIGKQAADILVYAQELAK